MISECLGINEQKHLTIGGMDTVQLAQQYGTPLYVMDEDLIRKYCRIYKNALDTYYNGNGLALYASKAFSCKYIYQVAKEEGLGVDVVSGGELYTALKAGFPMEKVYFHGNNKTQDELKMALENGVGRIVVDNAEELQRLSELANEMNCTAHILFRIKPGIDAHTHSFIQTGQIDSKFGVALETGEALDIVEKALHTPHVQVVGVHCHIGSQIFDLDPFVHAAEVMLNFMADVKDKLGHEMTELNLGGGFGIKYTENDDPVEYDQYIREVSVAVKKVCAQRGIRLPRILMEPGRSLVAPAGITLYTVGGVKEIPGIRTYVSVDGGMPDNPRYILYQSEYTFELANRMNEKKDACVTIAGKCCESGDLLGKDVALQQPHAGDILATLATGAYNYSMASHYNRIPNPPVVFVRNGESKLVVQRESYEDLIRNDL
ncbi:MAG: diaminopimelate decarboxylase [Eubacteriales bacterium]|jgi:diaminopimelate decarboxylase